MQPPIRAYISLPGGLRAFIVCVCIAIVGLYSYITWHAHEVAQQTALRESGNLAAALAQHASDTLETADGALLGLVEQVETDGLRSRSIGQLQILMAQDVHTMPRLHRLSIIDATGRTVVDDSSSSGQQRIDHRREEYFRYHRSSDIRVAHISGPVRNTMENSWVIIVSRRIDRDDGSFGGVAVAEISLDYFEQTYAAVNVGPSGVIALIRDDGTLAVRRPFSEAYIGRNVSSTPIFTGPLRYEFAGTDSSTSILDGVRRLSAFQRLDRYPLLVIVALAERDYFANWFGDATTNLIVMLAIVGMIAGLGRVLTKQIDQRKLAEERLGRLALVDGLTEIPNRRQFDEALVSRWRVAIRDKTCLALLMIDADFFKDYNDRYGHQAGDDALRVIATTIRENIRPSDLGARYGGEEFAVILSSTDHASAFGVAERIRESLAARALTHAGSECGIISVSIGVASVRPILGGGDGSTLLATADRALYRAKRAGRNRSHPVVQNAVELDSLPADTSRPIPR